jgi:hypothetical protein
MHRLKSSNPMASTKWSTSVWWTHVNTELHLTLPSDHVHASSNYFLNSYPYSKFPKYMFSFSMPGYSLFYLFTSPFIYLTTDL